MGGGGSTGARTERVWPAASAGGEEEELFVASVCCTFRFRIQQKKRSPLPRRGCAWWSVGVVFQDDRRDIASSPHRWDFAVFQRFCRPEARFDPVPVPPDAADHERVVFLHAARQQEERLCPAVLGCVEVFVQLALRNVFQAHARLPEEHSVDVFVDNIVVNVYRQGEIVHLLLCRAGRRGEFRLSPVF